MSRVLLSAKENSPVHFERDQIQCAKDMALLENEAGCWTYETHEKNGTVIYIAASHSKDKNC